jgi:glucose-6-phosphate-specific signal transduction histidine kinase
MVDFKYKKKMPFRSLEREFDFVAEKIEKLNLPKDFLQFILYVVSELFANVKEHSKAKKVSFEIEINKNCLIRVADDGIGLRKSYLLKKISPKDDTAAIEFALSGLSTKEPRERGFGLYTIRKFVEDLKGKMKIETGSALAIIEKNKIQFKKRLLKKKGVLVEVKTKIKDIDFYKIIK